MTDRLDEIILSERQKALNDEKQFKHDLSVILAASCLFIILLFLPFGIYWLFDVLTQPISRAISGIQNVPLDKAREMYDVFYRSELLEGIISLICSPLALIVPALFAKRYLINKPKNIYPLKAAFPAEAGRFIFFSMGLCYTVTLVCALLFGDLYPQLEEAEGSTGIFSLVVNFILLTIIAPFGEELLFRGVIYQGLSRYSQPFAIFLSALIFGLAHRNPPQVINAFVMGICLAIGFAKTKSITVCIMIHLANNAFAFMVTYALNEAYDWFAAVLGIGIIAVIGFTVVMLINFAVTKKAGILAYDDEKSDFPRLGGYRLRARLLSNFFFIFYIVLIAIGVTILYL